jgi:hypothetical protein
VKLARQKLTELLDVFNDMTVGIDHWEWPFHRISLHFELPV